MSWIGSLLPLGAIFGPFLCGFSAGKIGRKNTLIWLAIPFIAAYFMLAFGNKIPYFFVARLIIGIATGGVFTVIPIYTGEVSEDKHRGALGSVLNVSLCTGWLMSYGLGPFVSIRIFNIVLAIIPVLFLVMYVSLAPETPYYHLAKGAEAKANTCLVKLRGGNCDEELAAMKQSLEGSKAGTFSDLFKSKGLIKAPIIANGLMFFQQFSGINAITFYAHSIFEAAGSTLEPAYSSLIIAGVMFIASFVSPLFVDRLGRKLLLYLSGVGMLMAFVPLGTYCFLKSRKQNVQKINWLPIVSLVWYIISFNIGFGPLPWAILGEIFPNNVKAIASSITASFCWILAFFITKFFPEVTEAMGMGPSFWLFGGFCALAVLFVWLCVIETKKKSFQEIQKLLEG